MFTPFLKGSFPRRSLNDEGFRFFSPAGGLPGAGRLILSLDCRVLGTNLLLLSLPEAVRPGRPRETEELSNQTMFRISTNPHQ